MKRTENQSSEENKQTSTHVHTDSWYLVLRMIPCTVCWKGSTAQHGTAPHHRARHRTERHRTALRCALLSYSWAGLSWECIFSASAVLYVHTWRSSTAALYGAWNDTWHVRNSKCSKARSTAQHDTAQHSTATHDRVRHRTAPHGATLLS